MKLADGTHAVVALIEEDASDGSEEAIGEEVVDARRAINPGALPSSSCVTSSSSYVANAGASSVESAATSPCTSPDSAVETLAQAIPIAMARSTSQVSQKPTRQQQPRTTAEDVSVYDCSLFDACPDHPISHNIPRRAQCLVLPARLALLPKASSLRRVVVLDP